MFDGVVFQIMKKKVKSYDFKFNFLKFQNIFFFIYLKKYVFSTTTADDNSLTTPSQTNKKENSYFKIVSEMC